MSEPRFRVTIHDREKNRFHTYDVERIVAALCLPQPDGEAWMFSFRAVNEEDVVTAIMHLIERATIVLECDVPSMMEKLAQTKNFVPHATKTINYGTENHG